MYYISVLQASKNEFVTLRLITRRVLSYCCCYCYCIVKAVVC